MSRTIKALVVALAAVAVAFAVLMNQQAGERVVEAAALAAEDEHAGHAMTAAEHIAHMAAAGDIHAGHAMDEMRWARMPARQAAAANAALPADDMGAADRLAKSPRKGEYVTINVGSTPMRAWVVRPAGTGNAPVVLVIQEIFGLSDWIRGVADQLAAEGFIAVAPDLLSGRGPNGGDTSSFANQQEMMKATLSLPQTEVVARLKAARDWALKQPRANGKSATVGFCFGGAQSFTMAVEDPSLNAAVVYYGNAPSDAPAGAPGAAAPFMPAVGLAKINAPVLGLYADVKEDARIGNTIEPTRAKMKELGKTYEVHIFEGSAHGFLRAQTGNNGANMKASQQAWPMTVAWIKKHAS